MSEVNVAERLRFIFPSPAHVILSGVRNGTGYARKVTRTADALVLSVYPSRGIWMAGIEIKCSRSDWRRELANPDKADSIGKYCNRWYVAAPEGVVPVMELPEGWGLLETYGKTIKVSKQAIHNKDVTPPDMLLLCSILRRFSETMVPQYQVHEMVRNGISAQEERIRRDAEYRLDDLQDRVNRFETVSGISIKDGWSLGNVSEAVKVIVDAGSPENALNKLLKNMESIQIAIDRCKEALCSRK